MEGWLRARVSILLIIVALSSLGTAAAFVPQPAEYAIGAQDVLTIVVWEHADLSGKFTVETDGTISFPLIGRTKVSGLTVQFAENLLKKLLADGYVKQPQVSIVVEQFRSQQIFVMGEVKTPGGYPFTGELTLLEALARAGGASERAGSEVVVVRPTSGANGSAPMLPESPGQPAHVTRIDLGELQQKGSVGMLALHPGDTIFVPKAETVFVFGHVTRPGRYPIKKRTTLLQALSLAGGLTERGSTRRIKVVRLNDGKEVEVDIKPHDLVRPGDTIVVKERFF